MKRIVLALTAVAALTGSALAADLPARTYSKAPAMVAPAAPNWTGCYINAGLGTGMFNDERSVSDPNPVRPTTTSSGKGWLGALGAGCDYQLSGTTPFGSIVIGAFGEYDPSRITDIAEDPFNDTHSGRQTLSSAWFAGARAGLLVTPNLLTYVDGGWTGAHFNAISLVNTNGTSANLTLPATNANGWFLGSGIEYAFTFLPINGLFWRNEYRYASYSNVDQHYIHPTFVGAAIVHNSTDVQTATSSLVYKFNWGR